LCDCVVKHEVKIEVPDSVWVEAESRAKEENTDAQSVIRKFIEQTLEREFGEALPITDINKEDDTPI
jgi:hypothetical protein